MTEIRSSVFFSSSQSVPTKPGATNKWDAVGCRASLKSAQALLAQERRRIAKYNQKTADALRVVELEARP